RGRAACPSGNHKDEAHRARPRRSRRRHAPTGAQDCQSLLGSSSYPYGPPSPLFDRPPYLSANTDRKVSQKAREEGGRASAYAPAASSRACLDAISFLFSHTYFSTTPRGQNKRRDSSGQLPVLLLQVGGELRLPLR